MAHTVATPVELTVSMRVLLADDHPTILAGLECILRGLPHVQIVGTAASSDSLLRRLMTTPCDCLVTDFAMPGADAPDGLALLGFIRRRYPHLIVVLHSMLDIPAVLAQVQRSGIDLLVSKADSHAHLDAALRAARAGGAYQSPTIASLLARPAAITALSAREEEVLRLTAEGLGTGDIAARLHRTKQTISTQKRSAMRKLGVETTTALLDAWRARAPPGAAT